MPRALLLLVPLCALPACAADPSTSDRQAPVIGGTITPQGEFPAVGALWLDGQIECTGTLIRPDVVLTAAHCVEPLFIGDAVPGFTLDNDTVSAAPTVVAGARTLQHPSFDINVAQDPGLLQFYDVGLLWLASPITSVAPMEMATPEEAAAGFAADLDVAIVGYGRTSDATYDAGVKYDAVAKLVSWNDSEIQIGNGNGSPQNCNGDSGGPAFADFGSGPRQVGIVSRSFTNDNDCLHGGIDTRVDYYRAWIEEQLAAPCGGACPDAGVPDAAASPDATEGPDAGDPAADGGDAGCCSTGGGPGSLALALTLAVALVAPRRRARHPRR